MNDSRDEPLRVLHQDDDLLAIDKPAWSVVHKTRGADDALILIDAISEQLGFKPYPVHRLDRQTSGVMVFAKSSAAASRLGADVRQTGIWRKRYLGLCRGVIDDGVEVDHPVKEGDKRRDARSDFDPQEVLCDRYTFLRCVPHSGRRHQLRYHLRHINHPLVGDVRYGSGQINRFIRENFGLSRMFLHAEWLRINHPTENRQIEFSAPLADDLRAVLDKMRPYDGPVV